MNIGKDNVIKLPFDRCNYWGMAMTFYIIVHNLCIHKGNVENALHYSITGLCTRNGANSIIQISCCRVAVIAGTCTK